MPPLQRHRRRTADRTGHLPEIPYALVLACAAVGVLYGTLFSHWLRGVEIVGGAVILGGVFRAVLDERRAGLLAVRHRNFDTLCYLVFGAGIVVVGVITNRLAGG